MLSIKTILHPTDLSSCAEAALDYALDLARRHEAVLRVLFVTPVFGDKPVRGAIAAMIDEQAFYQRLHDEADSAMQVMLDGHDTAGVRIERAHAYGSALGEVITEYAVAEDVDLITLGTHGRRGLRKLFLGSVAQEVLQRAVCPVLIVRQDGAETQQVKRILAPIDFSLHSINALAYAKQLAELYGAALDVFHAIDPVTNERLAKAGLKYRDAVEREEKAEAYQRLAWLSKEIAGGETTTVTQHVRVGNPSQQIAEYAQESGAGLIVIASHGLGGLEYFPLGSVTERVVRTAPCPVFITRPFGKTLLPYDEVKTRKGTVRDPAQGTIA